MGIDVFTYVICNPNYGDGETICDTATVTVTVVNPVVRIPKAYQAISPNSDGKNDFFVIENIDYNGYNLNELVIFNRWGNIVFEAKLTAQLLSGTAHSKTLVISFPMELTSLFF